MLSIYGRKLRPYHEIEKIISATEGFEEKSLKKVVDIIKNDNNIKEEHKEAIQRIYILLNSSSHTANLNNHLSFAFSISIIELLNWKNIILDLEKK